MEDATQLNGQLHAYTWHFRFSVASVLRQAWQLGDV